jgi:hypothetical protein
MEKDEVKDYVKNKVIAGWVYMHYN